MSGATGSVRAAVRLPCSATHCLAFSSSSASEMDLVYFLTLRWRVLAAVCSGSVRRTAPRSRFALSKLASWRYARARIR